MSAAARGELAQRGDVARDLALDPALQPGAERGAALGRQAVERARGAHRGLEQGAAGGEAGEDMAVPADREAAGFLDIRLKSASGASHKLGGAAVELVAEAALGGGEQQALVGEAGGRIDLEIEAGEMADRLGPDADLAIGGDGHRQRVGAARADVAHQHRGAAVDEALGQAFVERVAQAAFDLARALGPFGGVGEPVGALGDIGPAADPGEAVGERLDIARDIVEPGDFGGEPFVRDVPALADVAEQAADHARVVHRPDLAEVGQPAHRPQFARLAARAGRRSTGSSAISLSTARSIASGAERSSGSSRARLEAGDEVGGGR